MMAGMGKYDELRDFLRHQRLAQVTLTFAEVAGVVPGGLPPSAYVHRAWWANEESGTHSHARSWLHAGYRTTDVNLTAGRVTFTRAD